MPHSTAARTATIDGHEIDVASLETINYGRLAAKEPAEVEKLLKACQMPGFFYLDFQSGPAKELIADVPGIYAASKQYFDQPQEVKMKDYRPEQDRSQDRGWVSIPIPIRSIAFSDQMLRGIFPQDISHMEKREGLRFDSSSDSSFE